MSLQLRRATLHLMEQFKMSSASFYTLQPDVFDISANML